MIKNGRFEARTAAVAALVPFTQEKKATSVPRIRQPNTMREKELCIERSGTKNF